MAVVYKPPRKQFCDDLEEILTKYSLDFTDIILCGDFNCDLNKTSRKPTKFLRLLNKFGCKIINSEPTYFWNNASSLLDLIITNTDKIEFYNQISVGFTDHDLIYFSYRVSFCKSTPIIRFRNFKDINIPKLTESCCSLDWHRVFSIVQPDEKIQFLCANISYLFEEFVPLKIVSLKPSKPPWLNVEILNMMKLRNFIFQRWKHTRNNRLFQEFKIIRNKINVEKTKAKIRYYSKVLNPSLPSKIFWKNLKSVNSFQDSGNFNRCPFSVDDLNDFFSSHSSGDGWKDCSRQLSHFEGDFSFKNIDIVELHDALDSVKSDATGADGIPIKFIKMIFPHIDCYLLHGFNSLIMSSTFPSIWKHSKIIPIPKKRSCVNLSDFRPISLLPGLSKVFERVLQTQIVEYLNTNNLLSEFQSAYRSNHSTTTALLQISDDIRRAIDRREVCTLVLLDFSKAFDRIDHELLIFKLKEHFRFSSTASRLIHSYLSGRSQVVTMHHSISGPNNIHSGVPQGSILGPFLFMMYINDLTKIITHCKYHLFADDVQIYRFCNPTSIEDSINKVNLDIGSIVEWSEKNRLCINSEKTQSIIISSYSRCVDNLPKISVNGASINFSDTVNNLGLIFDRTMCWNSHIEAISKRIIFLLRMLWTTTKCFSNDLRLRLVKSFVLPHFLYGDVVIFGLQKKYFTEILMLFNSCVRYVFRLRKFDHISCHSNLLFGCSLHELYTFRVCLFIYKLLRHQQPKYIFEKLEKSSDRMQMLKPARNNCKLMNSSFFVRGISIWNNLDINIRQSRSPAIFRNKYFQHFNFAP